MMSYRDTLTFDRDVGTRTQSAVEDYILSVGFIHGHKSERSVEFEFEAEDDWDLRGMVDEFEYELSSWGITYTPDKERRTE